MGDRWVSSNLAASTYIWLPLELDGTTASLTWYDSWNVDLASGAWSEPASVLEYEGEDGELSGGARTIDCSQCSGGVAAGYIGGDSDSDNNGVVVFDADVNTQSGDSERVTLNIRYLNGNTNPRYAAVSVNGGEAQTAAFISTAHHSDTAGSSAVLVELKSGANAVQISGTGGWGPDIDELVIPL